MSEIVEVEEINGRLVLRFLHNEMDMFKVPEIRNVMLDPLEKKFKIVIVDFKATSYMDSSALGYLFSLYKTVTDYGGRFILSGVNERIQKLLELNGATKYFEIIDELAEALESKS